MNDAPLVGARRFEAYVRGSAYLAVSVPAGNVLGTVRWADRLAGADLALWVAAAVLSLALTAGNIFVTKRCIDTVVGRPRRLPAGVVVVWAVALVALVGVAFLIPLSTMGITVAAAIGSVAASFVPVLDARRTLLLNAAVVVLIVPLVGIADIALLLVGAAVTSSVLWVCWSSVWLLRVLLELQAAHADRAALALANERLRIARDLHDVFGRTLATMAVKSSLASELVERGRAEQAGEEIAGVRRLAEEAGTEVRRVVRGELRTTWEGEVAGARSLLASAGIRCTVAGDPVPEECAQALAWVVREGVTNVLRHSAATQVTIATAKEDGGVLLTVANDGAGSAQAAAADGRAADAGTGLRSMSERIGALGGRLAVRRDGTWFLLDATIPFPKEAPA
ncbi:sensor histidine kinase [Nocardiopsis sediminis]|uniref:Sensor histidine kinase n=1 Tax=Nocardiopsis sediminis TaxID=1778267 RepID=A0ABV8FU45_9ACTN